MADAPSLPDGAETLSARVKAPPELARRLQLIGIVADEETGHRLQGGLKPGRAREPDSAVWRWDGFTVRRRADGAAPPDQRNKLAQSRAARCRAGRTRDSGGEHLAARTAVGQRASRRLVIEPRAFGARLIARAREAERQLVAAARRRQGVAQARRRRRIVERAEAERRARRRP
jgi:chromosome segregation protein